MIKSMNCTLNQKLIFFPEIPYLNTKFYYCVFMRRFIEIAENERIRTQARPVSENLNLLYER